MTTYSTKFLGDLYAIAGDFSDAASQITVQHEDGHWVGIGKQVADFRHDPAAAMREQLEAAVTMSGDDIDEFGAKIDAAIDRMAEDDAE